MAGPFPTSPNNLDLHTTDGGTVYQFLSDETRWVLYKVDISSTFILDSDIENPPTEDSTDTVPSSEWAYDSQFYTLMDATPAADGDYHGNVMIIDTTGCSTYDYVYIDGYNSVLPSNAGDISTMPVIGMVVASGRVLTHGTVRNEAWSLGASNFYYASTTAGEHTTTYPSSTDDIVQIVAQSVGQDEMFIKPSASWVMHV